MPPTKKESRVKILISHYVYNEFYIDQRMLLIFYTWKEFSVHGMQMHRNLNRLN